MVTISTIVDLVTTATGSIVGATEAGKNLKEIFARPEVDVTASKQLILELLDKLISAKMAQMDIQESVLALQRELKARDDFEANLARYVLENTGRGATIYTLKAEHHGGEKPHSVCPSCVVDRKKSILQPAIGRSNCLYCPICKAEFLADLGHAAGIMVAPASARGPFGSF